MDSEPQSSDRERKMDQVPIRGQWEQPDNLPTIYANQLSIGHAGPQFYLVFGELRSPVATSREEVPDIVPIRPVARIAVAPEAMLAFADVIVNNVTRYRDALERAYKEALALERASMEEHGEAQEGSEA
jgi:hypothetical protein